MSGSRIAVIVVLLVVASAFIVLLAVLHDRNSNRRTDAKPAAAPRREIQPQYVARTMPDRALFWRADRPIGSSLGPRSRRDLNPRPPP
jgi:hypothetical protein